MAIMNSAIDIITSKMSPANDTKTMPKKDSDDNANLSYNCARGQCTGAIPKTKTVGKSNGSHSNSFVKVNNNIDKVVSKKCTTSTSMETPQSFPDNLIHNDVIRVNHTFVLHPSCSRISAERWIDDSLKGESPSSACADPPRTISSSPEKCLNPNQPHSYTFNNIDPSSVEQKLCESDSSSDTGNDDAISIFDDGCIYTYKGDHTDDLASAFLNLEVPPPIINGSGPQKRPLNRSCSPEMDYLEMDFDPGQACDEDSDMESVSPDMDHLNVIALAENDNSKVAKRDETPEIVPMQEDISPVSIDMQDVEPTSSETITDKPISPLAFFTYDDSSCRPGPSGLQNSVKPVVDEAFTIPTTIDASSASISDEPSGFSTPKSPTTYVQLTSCKLHQSSNGNLLSPTDEQKCETDNEPPSDCAISDQSEQSLNPCAIAEICNEVTIWSMEEAAAKQTMQVASSACGATAVINVLNVFGIAIPSLDDVMNAVPTRRRSNESPMLEYLMSRSFAGSTHIDLIHGLDVLSGGQLFARFFHMYPERNFNLNMWLSYWIQNGAVPVATINLQKGICPDSEIPDAWHHQMIHGIGPSGVYLTNPLECKSSGLLRHQLTSESVLLIRRSDVLGHWDETTDLRDIMRIPDEKWATINVVGQIANMVRESRRTPGPGCSITPHIRIPASYSAGITLVAHKNSAAYLLLSQSPDINITT